MEFYGLSLILGLAAAMLQLRAMEVGYDHKGLFGWSTPSAVLMLLLGAVFAAVLAGMTMKKLRPESPYAEAFPRGWFRGSLMALGGAMLALDLYYTPGSVPAAMAVRCLGYAAAAGMAVCGVYTVLGLRPSPVFHGIVCVYALCDLLLCYREWGASSHLEQYLFSMLSSLLLMLYSFHRCAADAGVIRCRRLAMTGFGAVFCSLAALTDPGDKVFCLAVSIWIMGSMCSLQPREK